MMVAVFRARQALGQVGFVFLPICLTYSLGLAQPSKMNSKSKTKYVNHANNFQNDITKENRNV
jgi:hypothetical protein